MRSSEGSGWVTRWRYEMAPTSQRGIWRLKMGGYFVRVRVTDSQGMNNEAQRPPTGRDRPQP